MFLGEYFHSLDEKGRVVMPASFRRDLEDGSVISKGQDGQLVLYPREVFENKAAEVIERPQDEAVRQFSRTLFAGADIQTPDRSGRVLIKPELRQFAQLEPATEIAVIGVFDHVELWDKDLYLSDREAGDQIYKEEGLPAI